MQSEKEFWRLLGDYEELTRDESVALRESNFLPLAEIHEKKATLFQVLQEIGKDLGLDRSNAQLSSRLEALADAEASNAAVIDGYLNQARELRQGRTADLKRLKNLRHVYNTSFYSEMNGTFSAQG